MTNNDSNSESGGRPRRQHYASAMPLKQWGDRVKGRDTVIVRFDMHTRQTSEGTAGTECVFEDEPGAEDGGQAFRATIAEAEGDDRCEKQPRYRRRRAVHRQRRAHGSPLEPRPVSTKVRIAAGVLPGDDSHQSPFVAHTNPANGVLG